MTQNYGNPHDDHADLDEFDWGRLNSEKLSPCKFRARWSREYEREISERHDHAQALALSVAGGYYSLEHFRSQFAANLKVHTEQTRRSLLHVLMRGEITLRQLRDIREDYAGIAEKKAMPPEDKTVSVDEFVSLMLDGAPPEGAPKTAIVHDAKALKSKNSEVRDARDKLRLLLSDPLTLPGPDDEDEVDLLAAELLETSPWMREPIHYLWQSMKDSLEDDGVAQFRPILLVGPPGCGKTYLAERLANLSKRAWTRLDGSALTASFAITGADYTWRSSHAGEPVRLMAESMSANPLILVDEIEKTVNGSSGGDPKTALLPLLQRSSAARFQCPYLQAPVDLSWVSWVLLANSLTGLPAPLLDRVTVFRVGYPTGKHLRALVERELVPLDAAPVVIDRAIREIEAGRLTLRALERIKARMRELARRPILH